MVKRKLSKKGQVDKHKFWLILGISIALVAVIVLLLTVGTGQAVRTSSLDQTVKKWENEFSRVGLTKDMIDSLSLKETLDFHINGIVPVDKTRAIQGGNWFEKVYKNISDRLSSFFSANEDEVDSEKRSSSKNASTKTSSSTDSQKDNTNFESLTREEVRELRAKKFFKKIFNLNEDDNNDDDEEEDEEE